MLAVAGASFPSAFPPSFRGSFEATGRACRFRRVWAGRGPATPSFANPDSRRRIRLLSLPGSRAGRGAALTGSEPARNAVTFGPSARLFMG